MQCVALVLYDETGLKVLMYCLSYIRFWDMLQQAIFSRYQDETMVSEEFVNIVSCRLLLFKFIFIQADDVFLFAILKGRTRNIPNNAPAQWAGKSRCVSNEDI
jgi:hypothetical protein